MLPVKFPSQQLEDEKKSLRGRVEGLDALRGVAILLVVAYHFLVDDAGGDKKIYGWKWLLGIGHIGVSIFFVVSGFCIMRSFEGDRNWSTYISKRFFRIYPPYFLFLLIFTLWSGSSVFNFLAHALLVHNFLPGPIFFGINPSFWSIAVEVQFYFVFPILLILVNRFGWGRVLALLLAAGLIYLVVLFFLSRRYFEAPALRLFPLSSYGLWSAGAWLAARPESFSRFKTTHLWAAFGFVCFFCYILEFGGRTELFVAFFGGVAGFLAILILMRVQFRGLIYRFLCSVGVSSFSIYLFHQPLIPCIRSYLDNLNFYWTSTFVVQLSVVILIFWFLGMCCYRLFEVPSVRLGGMVSRMIRQSALRFYK